MTNYRQTKPGPYGEEIKTCPYCGYDDCRADHVDIGVGVIQCGPYYCPECNASEVGPYDTNRVLTEAEKLTGWYEPGSPVSETANTVGGVLVDHQTAKMFYDVGLLDVKRT